MKKITLIVLLFLGMNSLFAQAQKELNFGIGLNHGGFPVYASFDFPVATNIAIAPMIAFNVNDFDWMVIGAKGDYYFDELFGLPSAWDVYGGVNLGYRVWMGDEYDDNHHKDYYKYNENYYSSGLAFGLEVGARWFWSDKWGLNLEFGGGNYMYGARFGLTMKM